MRPLLPVACAALTVLASAATGLLAQTPRPAARVEMDADAMGTTFGVVLYGADRARLQEVARAALFEAIRLDELLSNYKLNSEWSAMNHHAASGPFPVSTELFDLLVACLEYTRATDGAFDITVAPLVNAWGFFRDEGRLPAPHEVRQALAHVGAGHVRLDPAARTVAFDAAGVELDPGGIGKGYAVDRMVDVLRRHRLESAFVSAGGSSLYGLGTPPDEPRGWAVPIRHPRDPARTAAEVFLRDMSLSTSGSYEKFFRAGGRVYSHILDPRTGEPARGSSSVSVVAPRTIDSEAWAKAYFIHGRGWAAAHRQPDTRVFMCDDAAEPRCAWVP